jgi:hypothetical protein
MPTQRIVTIAVSAMLVFVFTGSDSASACDCMRLKPLSDEVRREAAVIFAGKVVEIVERNEHTTTTYDGGAKTSVRPLERRVLFQVSSAWRGLTQARFSVLAEMTDCVFPFEPGGEYLVFANTDAQGRARTSICTRTASLKDAGEVLRVLGAPSYKSGASR